MKPFVGVGRVAIGVEVDGHELDPHRRFALGVPERVADERHAGVVGARLQRGERRVVGRAIGGTLSLGGKFTKVPLLWPWMLLAAVVT